jgi:hypothetical protein
LSVAAALPSAGARGPLGSTSIALAERRSIVRRVFAVPCREHASCASGGFLHRFVRADANLVVA